MSWRPHGHAEVDPYNPSAFAVCDRCGFWYNLKDLVWQWQYAGVGLVNLRILVCTRTCLDLPQPQLQALVLPADPPPVFNARPEPYDLDETDWLSTQDGVVIDTQDGTPIITTIPNPADDATANGLAAVEEAAVNITTEDGTEIVTEQGDGNPLDYEPNT
jgi:hypothetical protein